MTGTDADRDTTVPLARALAILRDGGVVAVPTETVYGLAADARRADAVAAVFRAKGRPPDHPLIVHLGPNTDPRDGWAGEWPVAAARLAGAFWPGPLTLLVPRGPRVDPSVTGGRPLVGLRVPDHAMTAELLDRFGAGVAAPSANRFGRVSPTSAADVTAELPGVAVLDGGPSVIGIESTIVDVSGERPVVRRPGVVTPDQIIAVLRAAGLLGAAGVEGAVDVAGGNRPGVPGGHASHYAPTAEVRLVDPAAVAAVAAVAAAAGRSTVVLAPLGVDVGDGATLQPVPVDAAGYARGLYRRLRDADAAGAEVIVVARPRPRDADDPDAGLWAAVVDRLTRAATSPGPN